MIARFLSIVYCERNKWPEPPRPFVTSSDLRVQVLQALKDSHKGHKGEDVRLQKFRRQGLENPFIRAHNWFLMVFLKGILCQRVYLASR